MENNSKTVVVVGSGSAGFLAAIAAREAGLEPIILESTDKIGGSSAMSGGGAWIPNNHLMLAAGTHDSYEDARKYMDLTIGDVGPASSPERRDTFLREGPRMVKWLEDKVLSSLILLLISPIMVLLALGVKLTSPGPVFYRQERVGLNSRPFNMLKFRSMPVDTEKSGVQWGGSAAKATTQFGQFIRKTSLDELPQFLNVLKGDMSIVGPRPERPMFVEKFKEEIPDYMKKHMVKAGITGWAQVHGWRGDTDLKTRIEYDLYYIENWSLWLDLKIIVMTVFKGFVNKNAY